MWWRQNRGALDFEGLKLSTSSEAVRSFHDVHLVKVRVRTARLLDEPGRLGSGSDRGGGNSGFQAINLSVQFGPPSRIILIGFDMRVDLGTHWHGRHTGLLNNPSERNVILWRMALDAIAPDFLRRGIEVLNASSVSHLGAYPKINLSEVL